MHTDTNAVFGSVEEVLAITCLGNDISRATLSTSSALTPALALSSAALLARRIIL